jgi:hypothetical protein
MMDVVRFLKLLFDVTQLAQERALYLIQVAILAFASQ